MSYSSPLTVVKSSRQRKKRVSQYQDNQDAYQRVAGCPRGPGLAAKCDSLALRVSPPNLPNQFSSPSMVARPILLDQAATDILSFPSGDATCDDGPTETVYVTVGAVGAPAPTITFGTTIMSMVSTETVAVATSSVVPESASSGFSVTPYAVSSSVSEATPASPSSGKSSPTPGVYSRFLLLSPSHFFLLLNINVLTDKPLDQHPLWHPVLVSLLPLRFSRCPSVLRVLPTALSP